MMGGGDAIDVTDELQTRHDAYETAAGEYLHACGVAVCSETKWEGEYIKPHELPDEEKDRLAKLRETWVLKQKIEEVTDGKG